jgi:hypothetical protein
MVIKLCKLLKKPDDWVFYKDGVGFALTDTPISTAPSSPRLYVPPARWLSVILDEKPSDRH